MTQTRTDTDAQINFVYFRCISGRLTYLDGNDYLGEWEDDHIKGVGVFEFQPAEGEKTIKLKVFGF